MRLLYGCEIWYPTVCEGSRLRRFVNRVLRILFGPKEDEVICNGGDYIMRNFMICITHRILLG